MNHVYQVLDEKMVSQFEVEAKEEMRLVGGNENHFFRKYAFENMEEFFAVAVENFFERSAAFREKLPRIYDILVALFGQNPLNSSLIASKDGTP